MHAPSQIISAYLLKDLVRKLDPRRFPGMPPVLAALTGFLLGAEFFTPSISEIVITDSGIVLARVNGDTDAKHVLGRYSDILQGWMSLLSRGGLTPHEFAQVQCLFAEKVGFLGPTTT